MSRIESVKMSISETLSNLAPDIDFSAIFSGIGESVETTLASIPESIGNISTSIGESFSQIPTAASIAFTEISTFASESWSNIQTVWSELPGFFGNLWSGAGAAASSAGSAIASGINSAIGTIQSAWEGLSSWLSAKISSLASMASNAASSVMGFFGGGGSIGHNASGTSFWSGGWTEINEHGGEILDLPSGTRIYPHATTIKMLQREIQNGTFNNFVDSSNLIAGQSIISTLSNSLTANQFAPAINPQMQMSDLPAAPQFPSFEGLIGNSLNTTNNSTTNNNGGSITITGNNFNIKNESDIANIAYELMKLLTKGTMNFGSA